jgi:hypothetical protein
LQNYEYVDVARTGENRNACGLLVERPELKRQLGRSTYERDDNINMDRRETRLGGMEWIHLARDRDQCRAHVNAVTNLLVP